MVEKDFTINGRDFKLSKINALKQFHIARRISPILSDLIPVMGQISKVEKNSQNLSDEDKFNQFAKIAEPIFLGFSRLSDEDSDKLLHGLLSSVEVKQQSGNWAKVSNGSMLMFDDMDLSVLLQAAGRAFMFNMAGFIVALPQNS